MEIVMTNSKWTRVLAVAMAGLMLPLLAAAKGRIMPHSAPSLAPHSTAHVSSAATKSKSLTSSRHAKPKAAVTKSKKTSAKSSKSKTTKLHTKSNKATKLSAKPQSHRATAHKPALNKQ